MKAGKPTREERLAAALRENLKRRKARAKALNDALAEAAKAQGQDEEAPPSRRRDATKQV
jgi:hypothetical protein